MKKLGVPGLRPRFYIYTQRCFEKLKQQKLFTEKFYWTLQKMDFLSEYSTKFDET